MSLLGLDVGTTGCKACAFSSDGRLISAAYREYDIQRPQPGQAELDAAAVWGAVRQTIAEVAAATAHDPISALCACSLGEAVVPVSQSRQILGPSILNFDERGAEYLESLAETLDETRLYARTGNTLGNHYTLTKLLWLRDHQPSLYEAADLFLHWGAFVSYMLGADAVVDYALANRTLLFDLDAEAWSGDLLEKTGLDQEKLPALAPSGTAIGTVAPAIAGELGLAPDVAIVTGAHDQCANALGCGVLDPGQAMFGMGTYICIVPIFLQRQEPAAMLANGLNTEHHAAPGRFVSFIYNHGGSLMKWYRDTFAAADHEAARASGHDIYTALTAEMPEGPSPILVLPHFAPTGPPEFIADSSGLITGLRLETTRGEILKGILEGTVFYLRECLDELPQTGIRIDEFRAVGGGSRSDAWLQLAADILDRPLTRTLQPEAGALGSAILAGAATGTFASIEEGVQATVGLGATFEPRESSTAAYRPRFERYKQLWPALKDLLAGHS